MREITCQFPEFLKDGEPGTCSCAQMRLCHEKSGGVHPLPSQEQEQKEKEAQEK